MWRRLAKLGRAWRSHSTAGVGTRGGRVTFLRCGSGASATEAEDRAAFPSGRDGTTTFEVDAPRPTRRQNKTGR